MKKHIVYIKIVTTGQLKGKELLENVAKSEQDYVQGKIERGSVNAFMKALEKYEK